MACKKLNKNTTYCEKKRRYVDILEECSGCPDYEKPTLNENLEILTD